LSWRTPNTYRKEGIERGTATSSSTRPGTTSGPARSPFWTSDTGIDGKNPIDLDELDLLPIEPIPSHVWYADMADFVQQVSDGAARQRLARALSGRGAFRRFKNELYEEYPGLVSVWQAFRDARAQRRAVGWSLDQGFISNAAAQNFTAGHPDPAIP
jgi:uncharacterized protein UPF0158